MVTWPCAPCVKPETTIAPLCAACGSSISEMPTGVLICVEARAFAACSAPGGASRFCPCSLLCRPVPTSCTEVPALVATVSRSFPHPMNAVTAHTTTPQTTANLQFGIHHHSAHVCGGGGGGVHGS